MSDDSVFVGVLTLELVIPESSSLKAKRSVLRSVKDKIQSAYNVSVAEIAGHDKWQRAVIGVAGIGNDQKYLNGMLNRIADEVQSGNGFYLSHFGIKFL